MPLNPPMKASDRRIAQAQHDEGLSLKAYPDPRGQTKTWAIGYGTNAPWVKPGMTCTEEQANGWLMDKIKSAESCINRLVNVELEQHEFDALVDFVYNVGEGSAILRKGFAGSTLLKKLNLGDKAGAAQELLRWVYAGGEIDKGLVGRRQQEQDEFEGKEDA